MVIRLTNMGVSSTFPVGQISLCHLAGGRDRDRPDNHGVRVQMCTWEIDPKIALPHP